MAIRSTSREMSRGGAATSLAYLIRPSKTICRCISLGVLVPVLLSVTPSTIQGQSTDAVQSTFSLKSLDGLEVLNGKAEVVTYRGRRAVHLIPSSDYQGPEDSVIGILGGSNFGDGIIEAEVAGIPRSGAPADARGFIGISFHVQPHGSRLENIYLRPINGRADDQLRRNHSVQYTSEPDFPWYRLRQENSGGYESYVDLEPGTWTRMKIIVSGKTARLYVNGATQPCLIVKDLKMGQNNGAVAIWAHSSTDGYFSSLRITTGSIRKR